MEIELKARVKDFTRIKRRLKQLGARFDGRKHQIDTYYSPYKQPLTKRKGRVLRIRRNLTTGQTRLEVHIPQNSFAAIEHEVTVGDYRTLVKIMKGLRMKKEFVVEKRREQYIVGRFEIELDTVRGLGKFVEVELEGANSDANKQRVIAFMRKLGVADRDFLIGTHYNGMILKKMGRKYAYF